MKRHPWTAVVLRIGRRRQRLEKLEEKIGYLMAQRALEEEALAKDMELERRLATEYVHDDRA